MADDYVTTGATTGEQVFELTMSLIDELDDQGEYDTRDTQEYRNRTLSILNVLRGELYPFSDTYKKNAEWQSGRRPIVGLLNDLDDVIDLDDYICQSVLPYGLAAHLLLDENPTTASFFQQRYDELKRDLARGLPVESEDIVDLYAGPCGGHYYDQFGMWI